MEVHKTPWEHIAYTSKQTELGTIIFDHEVFMARTVYKQPQVYEYADRAASCKHANACQSIKHGDLILSVD